MAKAIHIHLHDFAGAGFRTQQGLRGVTRDVRSISYKQIQEMFRNGQWEAMSDLRKMGETWGTQWVKRRVSGEWQPSEAVRVEQIPKDMNYKDCGCAKCAAARDTAREDAIKRVKQEIKDLTEVIEKAQRNGHDPIAYVRERNQLQTRLESLLKKPTDARDMQQAYHGYLIKTGLRPDEYYISKDGQHIGTASTLQAAKQIIDQIADD